MIRLNLDRLQKFIDQNKEEIYCVYAGIYEDWDYTSDEIYYCECGWIDDHDALVECYIGTPVAYIHYKDYDIKVFKETEEI